MGVHKEGATAYTHTHTHTVSNHIQWTCPNHITAVLLLIPHKSPIMMSITGCATHTVNAGYNNAVTRQEIPCCCKLQMLVVALLLSADGVRRTWRGAAVFLHAAGATEQFNAHNMRGTHNFKIALRTVQYSQLVCRPALWHMSCHLLAEQSVLFQ